MGGIYRLKGPLGNEPLLSVGQSERSSKACESGPTHDLLLSFPAGADKVAQQWLALLQDSDKAFAGGPCDVAAQPLNKGGLELRLAYPKKQKNTQLQLLSFRTGSSFVIDHWVADGSARKVPSKGGSASVIETQKEKKAARGSVDTPRLVGGAQLDAFEDPASWDAILGNAATALDLNSPELDRFRAIHSTERNLGIPQEPVERRELRVPLLEMPQIDRFLEFGEQNLDLSDFAFGSAGKPSAQQKRLRDGMNFVATMARKGDWRRAVSGLTVLEGSKDAAHLPQTNARWWALKGLVHIRYGEELKDPAFKRRALDIWREGLRKTVGFAANDQPYVEYMLLEHLRYLFQARLSYAALSLINWASKYGWSLQAQERISFLKGEAMYQLGLYDEARKVFTDYFDSRADIPLSASADRRLVPASAFRIGDASFRAGNWQEAINDYSKAIGRLPSADKVNFEGVWLPGELAEFPHVLYNRAEAGVILGRERDALKDLRAFMFLVPNHASVGLVYYRIGDLLSWLRVDRSMIDSAWRECQFRVPNTLGARMCRARESAEKIATSGKTRWPRLVGEVEELRPSGRNAAELGLSPDNLDSYVAILLADVFIRSGDPYQAYARLQPLEKLEPSAYMRTWAREYYLTALAGYLQRMAQDGRARDAIKLYEERKREAQLFRQTRPELLWGVALAHQALALWPEALQVLAQVERLQKGIGRQVPRPFDPPIGDMNFLRAQAQVALYRQGRGRQEDALAGLEKLPDNEARTHRLWIELAAHAGNKKLEGQHWRRLESLDALSWEDFAAYSECLRQLGATEERRLLLERRVGSWFLTRDRSAASAEPPAEFLIKLLDARIDKSLEASASEDLAAPTLSLLEFVYGKAPESKKGAPEGVLSRPMLDYKRGLLLKKIGRLDEARQSFARAKAMAPESLWGKLSASAEKEIPPPQGR